MTDRTYWRRIAERAERRLETAPLGARERTLSEAAESAGVALQTMRTYLVALRCLRSLPPSLAAQAAGMPAIALETVSRWMAHDRDGALDAVRAYVGGKLSVRKLARAESEARSPRAVSSGRSITREYAATVAFRTERMLLVWSHGRAVDLAACGEPEADDNDRWVAGPSGKADFLLRMPRGGTIAVLVVRPTVRHYAVDDWCLWAVGLAALHGRAALVVPADAPVGAFSERLDAMKKARGRVQLMRDPLPPDHGLRRWYRE